MFTHLHLHTEYSLLDGACRIKQLVKRIKELGMDSCAITDHGVMYGVVDFYREMKDNGLHPVIGCEVYVSNDMLDKSSNARDYSHLVLLCENQEGYSNLIKLVSEGFTRGFYYKPRVDYALLKKYSKGLIALSACLSGDIPKLLLANKFDKAIDMANRYIDIFGRDNFFIELQDHALSEEKQVLPRLIRLAGELGLGMVATNDCHYLTREDASAQEVLMCIQTGKTLSDENRMRMNTDQMYVKSEEEMRALFPQLNEAIENTEIIAKRCNVEFDFSTRHLPKYPLPEGETDATEYFTRMCREGIKEKYGDNKEAWDRLEYELSVIISMGFVDYYLIVWDFIHYAKTHGVGVGPGRGSGAGSIAAYAIGITMVDPLKYNLIFERFLNPERVSMPDFDVDFDYEGRADVIKYVARRYGEDHVSQIITFGTMAARQAIRDVGRVLGHSYQETDAIAKMVPFELGMTLDRALEISPELKKAYEDERVKQLLDTARKLEGMPRHASTHAAGVLITSKPVDEYVPLQTNDDVITTQFPMTTLESLGLLKMDFLGLRTLNVINDTLAMLKEQGIADMTSEDIPIDDPEIYKMISSGDTDGVFQLESSGMKSFLMSMKPENFEDVIAAISLYRPGPMDSIPKYIAGKRDPGTVTYLDEKLRPILDVTYGCMVYQEQVMQIVRDLAGYSMGRSDLVRRAMAKKKHEVMIQEKKNFIYGLEENGKLTVPGALRNGVSEEAAEKIFDEMVSFASYAFNKSHAAAYAVVGAQTAWLKRHHLPQFMASLMNSIEGNTSKIAYYLQYCKKHDIELLPPDVNYSRPRFSVEMKGQKACIRFGLNAIKNLGHQAVSAVVNERERGGDYRDLFDFIERNAGDALNKKGVESMIEAGALDRLSGNRAQKLYVFEKAMDGVNKRGRSAVSGQMSLFGELEDDTAAAPTFPDIEEFPPLRLLQLEKEVTGVYITGHPLDEYSEELGNMDVNSSFLLSLKDEADGGLSYDGRMVTMGGILTDKRMKATKSGGMMAFVQLEDLYGTTEALVFPKVYERVSAQLVPDTAVALTGRLSVREDEDTKLLLESVAPLKGFVKKRAPAAAQVSGHKLYLKMRKEQTDEVLRILKSTPGGIRVICYFEDEGKKYTAPQDCWVNEYYDYTSLRAILGEGAVVYK